MKNNITLPINLDFNTWASQIHQDLPNLSIPIPGKVEHWREWAAQLIRDNTLQNVPLPTTLAYPKTEDWKIWAVYFVDSIYNNI